ncbi:MAG: hypothetical protein OEL56_04265 [Nitrosopumilus sp.]|nr:hypothetical protein [Nitrosopumilus sp.]MDH3515861.1 hypothetical protein [Nitrosopumilus sp.]MDH3564785.1 hypothetical protein [Nitrosopumilus sp.]MDH5418702.1 hypothetical protein [Nitrosopumilus sp.]MDH5555256.1 hypothetical protein [Nitrosopumilus sp.]
MNNLPKKFPEYSIMYKTISNQIFLLEKRAKDAKEQELREINTKIEKYQLELNKIKNMFPDKFFE